MEFSYYIYVTMSRNDLGAVILSVLKGGSWTSLETVGGFSFPTHHSLLEGKGGNSVGGIL